MALQSVYQYANATIPAEADDLAEILCRDIPWETYMTARLIADKDLQLIRRYDKRSEELQVGMLCLSSIHTRLVLHIQIKCCKLTVCPSHRPHCLMSQAQHT
eukprot:GHRR01032803.1.p1 GENE.GHRR01032803.1~~GHRR01032803.1.p1  ORF type:complete len:102 (+),score=14.73 GHRR01032803.1:178-483(+)